MESTEHDKQAQTHTPQERKIGRRCIAVGAIILALQIGLMSWVMSDDSREERGTERPQPKSSAQVFGPRVLFALLVALGLVDRLEEAARDELSEVIAEELARFAPLGADGLPDREVIRGDRRVTAVDRCVDEA